MASTDEKIFNGQDLETYSALIKQSILNVENQIPTLTSLLINNSNFVADANYVHTDNNYTSQEKTKLSGIEAGAEVNVQADWNVTDPNSDAFVKNKPAIDAALSSSSTNAVQNKVVKAALDTKVNTSDLASVTEDSEGAGLVGYGTKTDGGTTTNVSVKDALDEIYESIGDGGDLATRVSALEEGKEDKFFIISVTKSGNSFVKDKLDADIKAAYRAGKRLMVKYTTTSSTTVLLPLVYVYEPTLSTFVFQAPNDNFTRDIRAQIDGDEVSVTVVAYQSALTFDESPTANSDNPVKSGGVYSALQEKKDNDFFVKYVVEYGILTDFELQVVSVDKTYAEVKEAYEQGKTLIGVFAYSGMIGENYLSLINAVQRDSDYEFRFTKCDEEGEVLSIYMDKAVNKAYRSTPHRVRQSPVSSNEDFPMLLAGKSGISSMKTTYTKYDTDLKYNPSTNTLKLGTGTLTATNYSGTSAKATNDADGNPISSTYLKVSNLIIGDGSETLLSNVTAMSERATVEALNDKLDTISDLSTIRSGAAAGATAYQKPSTGIPKSDLSSSVLTSLGKADTALQQHQDLSSYADGAEYDSANHLIYLKHGSTRLANPINANDFIKDGMVDTVEVIGGNLVITFNTDSGKLPITIPISDIFDANNYYNKTESDNRYLLISDLEAITNNEIDIIVGETLPYDAEIEYLGSSGTQYIDTGLIGDIDLNFEVTAKTNNVSSYYAILGDRASSSSRRYTLITNNSANPAHEVYFTFNTSANQVTANGSVNNVLNFQTYKKDDLKCYINGTLKGTLETATFTTPNNVILFGMRNNGTLANLLNGAISSCKFSKNGVLLRDFIPVRVGQVGYMYDKVSGLLFGNAGTGSFILGNDVTT